ncbi:hypothetical protein EJP77_07235 [Paenibacillus zeisoli]|uniref:Uncharacterized protein n=1 Tax=Paenibacillus zeisoli TaxID=2496267 RepID=A0A433XI92_9BACL|nr:hypothetical protein EJP77_07235 [Paenibacillus zeisoli]
MLLNGFGNNSNFSHFCALIYYMMRKGEF